MVARYGTIVAGGWITLLRSELTSRLAPAEGGFLYQGRQQPSRLEEARDQFAFTTLATFNIYCCTLSLRTHLSALYPVAKRKLSHVSLVLEMVLVDENPGEPHAQPEAALSVMLHPRLCPPIPSIWQPRKMQTAPTALEGTHLISCYGQPDGTCCIL